MESRKGTQEATNLKDYFLQYNIFRQFRHALIHNDGKLKPRHKNRLENIFKEISIRQPQLTVDLNAYSPWIKNDRILVDVEFICQMEYFRKVFTGQLLSNATKLKNS